MNVSELGLVTQSGQVVWGKYAQGAALVLLRLLHASLTHQLTVTNNPENDGVVNAVLLV